MSSYYENVNNANLALEASKKKKTSLITAAVHTIKKMLRKLNKKKCKVAPVEQPKVMAPEPLSAEELQNLINEALEEQSTALLLVVSPDCDLRNTCGLSLKQQPEQQSPVLPHHCCDLMISSTFSLHQLPTIQTPTSDYYYY